MQWSVGRVEWSVSGQGCVTGLDHGKDFLSAEEAVLHP